jgi:hypothetical protein
VVVDSVCGLNGGGFRVNRTGFSVGQSMPNPASTKALVEYTIPATQHVTFTVYNSRGETVRKVVDDVQTGGTHSAVFDALDLPSGIYYYRVEAGPFSEERSMMLMK